jgi:hypothetical protein
MARANGGVLIMWLKLIVAVMLMSCSNGGAAGIGNLRRRWMVVPVNRLTCMPPAGKSKHTLMATVTTTCLA